MLCPPPLFSKGCVMGSWLDGFFFLERHKLGLKTWHAFEKLCPISAQPYSTARPFILLPLPVSCRRCGDGSMWNWTSEKPGWSFLSSFASCFPVLPFAGLRHPPTLVVCASTLNSPSRRHLAVVVVVVVAVGWQTDEPTSHSACFCLAVCLRRDAATDTAGLMHVRVSKGLRMSGVRAYATVAKNNSTWVLDCFFKPLACSSHPSSFGFGSELLLLKTIKLAIRMPWCLMTPRQLLLVFFILTQIAASREKWATTIKRVNLSKLVAALAKHFIGWCQIRSLENLACINQPSMF